MTIEEIARVVGAEPSSWVPGLCATHVATDSREVRAGALFFALPGAVRDGHEFVEEAFRRGAAACVCSRDGVSQYACGSVAGPVLVVPDTLASLTALAQHYRNCVMPTPTTVVGVTGSNGKTTTKRMIDHVLSAFLPGRASPRSFNNHVGVPMTLLSAEPSDRYLIAEIGTNARGEIDALSRIVRPDIGVISSIGEAHLEGLGGIDGVAEEKASLLDHIREGGVAVVNTVRPELDRHLRERRLRISLLTVGTQRGDDLRVSDVKSDLSGVRFVLSEHWPVELGLPGAHHAFNAAAAYGVCRRFAIEPADIIARLKSFRPADGRTRRIETGGVVVVDDAYNANPASMRAAIDALATHRGGRRIFVMGEMRELGAESDAWHQATVAHAVGAGLERVVLVGPTLRRIAAALRTGLHARVVCCSDVSAAVEIVLHEAREGDAVWVKGSRLAALEKLVEAVVERLGAVRAA
jgi:UDP-N-acetylmuramoyl-tripeptide--D-alanyl-D-alanine ligase